MRSESKELLLGCVQGSVLGPELFNMYMKDVVNHVNGQFLTSYADDAYVLITNEEGIFRVLER